MLLFYLSLILLLLVFCYMYWKDNNYNKIISNVEIYNNILQEHLDSAYSIIFKNKLLLHTLENDVGNKIINDARKEFISLVLKMLGKPITKKFNVIYGNKLPLLLRISNYFDHRFESDELNNYSKNMKELNN